MAEYYQSVIAPSGVLDMVFLSLDFEKDNMRRYLAEPKLACPAVRYEDIEAAKARFKGIYDADTDGVPSYILLDAKGNLISKSIEEPVDKIAELIKGTAG